MTGSSREALRRLAESNDFVAIRAFEEFHSRLLESINADPMRVEEGIHPEAEDLWRLLKTNASKLLDDDDAVSIARHLLAAFAEHEEFAHTVSDCLENWPDDTQAVGKILAVGLVGAVWMCIASTTVVYEGEHIRAVKQPFTAEQIEASSEVVMRRVTAAIKLASETVSELSDDCEDEESEPKPES